MKREFIDLGKLSVSKANMRAGSEAPDIAHILPTVRERVVLVTTPVLAARTDHGEADEDKVESDLPLGQIDHDRDEVEIDATDLAL